MAFHGTWIRKELSMKKDISSFVSITRASVMLTYRAVMYLGTFQIFRKWSPQYVCFIFITDGYLPNLPWECLRRGVDCQLVPKGCAGIESAYSIHSNPVDVKPGDLVHIHCRKDFTRPSTKTDTGTIYTMKSKWSLRYDNVQYDFKSRCLFCSPVAKFNQPSRKRAFDVYPVRFRIPEYNPKAM